MNKEINGWAISNFSVKPTYSGLYEGNPANPRIIKGIIEHAEEKAKKEFSFEQVNIFNSEIGEGGRLPRFQAVYVLENIITDKTCCLIIFVDEIDNIYECLEKVLQLNPELKVEDWEF